MKSDKENKRMLQVSLAALILPILLALRFMPFPNPDYPMESGLPSLFFLGIGLAMNIILLNNRRSFRLLAIIGVLVNLTLLCLYMPDFL